MKNIMKTAAFAASVGMAATALTAETYFGLQNVVMDDNSITIDLIVAEMDGNVAIYDFSGGGIGELLGSSSINMGANDDVVVNLGENIEGPRVLAVVYEGDITTPDMGAATMTLDVSM